MAFRIKVYTFAEYRSEGVFYLHEQAFSKAIALERMFEMPIIEEHRWESKTNQLVTKTYYSRNKAIYTKDDAINPIYSFLPEHTSTVFYRKMIYIMCKKVVKIYDYYKIPCPYNDEYIYSFSLAELKDMENLILQDTNIFRFNKDLEYITKGILDTIKVLNVNIPDFYNNLINLDAQEMMIYVRNIEKGLKMNILKNVYGMSYIENF